MSVVLKNSRLRVEIQRPGELYRSSRFDPSTLVTSVLLDGSWEFLSREMADGSLADRRGHGLACEFGIRTPWGYEDCPQGDCFPKIGVGWVPRTSRGPYDFYRHEPDFRPLKFSLLTGPSWAVFQADSGDHRGFRWYQERKWTLEEGSLRCRTTLENRGIHPLFTTEYAHNFVTPGGGPLTPEWKLETGFPLSVPPDPWGDRDCWRISDTESPGLVFLRRPLDQFGSGESPVSPGDSWWRLRDRSSGCRVREELVRPGIPFRFEFWGAGHTFSPELFHSLGLEPGEKAEWERIYTFGRD